MKDLWNREKWKHYFYTLSHPADGFYWIRHQEKGSVAIALMMVLLFSLAFSINRAYASFVVNDVDPRSVNGLTEMLGVMLLFVILCVGNWSVTCLMGGEGRFKDIVTAVGYAFGPIALTFAVATIFSQAVAENEGAFYTIILLVGVGYGLILMMIGIMTVHSYTLGKALLTLLLTFVAMLIIIFLGMLVTDLIAKVVNFISSVYTELIYRM